MTVSPSKRRMSGSIARLVAVAALGLGGLVVAGTAGAQECGTYGPACPTGSGGGPVTTAVSGTGGPDSGALPDSASNDAGNPPSGPEAPSSNGEKPSNPEIPISSPDVAPAPTAAPIPPASTGGTTGTPGTSGTSGTGGTPSANPITVGGVAQPPVAGELGRTGTSAGTIAIVAAAVVLLGSALVLGARRRKQG